MVLLASFLFGSHGFGQEAVERPTESAQEVTPPRTSEVPNAVPSLADAISELRRTIAGYGGQLGVAILDIESGKLLGAHHDRVALNPASNAKVLTAAAALAKLDGSYRFQTGLYGNIQGSTVNTLVLRGHGDPSFRTKDLWEMVQKLKDSGIRRIDGDIIIDQRFFDEDFVPPAFDQQPNEWAYFRAPVSALSLNSNTVAMHIRAGAKGSPATVWFDPPGFVDIDGEVKTIEAGKSQNVILDLSGQGKRLAAKIGGHVPASAQPMRFVRRVDDPMLLAGYALKALLNQAGIVAKGEVKVGSANPRSILAIHRSEPLSALLYEVGKLSDNFYAEMIYKTLGAEKKGRPGTSDGGGEVVSQYLEEIGAMEDGIIVKNGSGLFDANRTTPLALVKVLREAYRNPAISSEFVAHLAIGGADGTLRSRFRNHRSSKIVRAKTGTLASVATLSGYVLDEDGKRPMAFSILVNGVPGKVAASRQAMDRVVEAMIAYRKRTKN